MEIIIRSWENGWETERRLELPEDDGLVKSILRSVKRRVNPPLLGGVTEHQEEPEGGAEQAAEPEARVEEDTGEPDKAWREERDVKTAPLVERTTFDTGYRGFLILDCEGCGSEYITNARQPMEESVCRVCGHVTRLEEMAAVEMCCPDCGKTWWYKTNSEQADVSASCITCGAVMVSEWDRKLRRYVPKKLEREAT